MDAGSAQETRQSKSLEHFPVSMKRENALTAASRVSGISPGEISRRSNKLLKFISIPNSPQAFPNAF
jgi:hypothetical protein